MVVKSGDIRHDMTKCLILVDQATCAAAQIEQILSWVETTQTNLFHFISNMMRICVMICTVDVGKVDKESKLTLISFKVTDCIAFPTERQTAFTLVVDSIQEIHYHH